MTAYRSLYTDENYQSGINELADLRKADLSQVSNEGPYELKSLTESFERTKVCAIKSAILTSSDLAYGLASMYSGASGFLKEQVKVFRAEKEALTWLGIEKSAIQNYQ